MEDITLKEKARHGNSMFPLNIYSIPDINGTYSLSHHWHNEIEIVYVEEGELIFQIDTQIMRLSQGECIFINSGQLHSAYASDNKASIHHAIVFDANMLSSSIYDYCQNKYIDPILNKSIRLPLYIDCQCSCGKKVLNEILEIIDAYTCKLNGWELAIKASLLKLISILAVEDKLLKKDIYHSVSKDYKVELIKKVLNFIHNNYRQKIYVHELAQEINLNTQYFCKLFKSVIGKTPVEYINHYRVEQAAKILQTGNSKIIETCYSVGFDNFSYFIKKFKEYKNCTPLQYKRNI
ncbi:MAG: AraC family transcriptional regulator [Clostridiaceae bacterium]